MKIDSLLILGSRLAAGAITLIGPFALTHQVSASALTSALAWIAGGLAAAAFVRTLLDRRARNRIEAINAEAATYAAERPGGVKLHDQQWGLFGARYGTLPGRIVQVTLFVELLIAQWSLGTSHPLTGMIGAGLFAAISSTILEMTRGADAPATD